MLDTQLKTLHFAIMTLKGISTFGASQLYPKLFMYACKTICNLIPTIKYYDLSMLSGQIGSFSPINSENARNKNLNFKILEYIWRFKCNRFSC